MTFSMDTLPSITACKVNRLKSGTISVYALLSLSNKLNTGCYDFSLAAEPLCSLEYQC